MISLFTSRREEILKKIEEKLQEIDICSYVMKDRSNTKWKFFAVTNVKFFLYYSGFMLGAPVNLPNYMFFGGFLSKIYEVDTIIYNNFTENMVNYSFTH